MGVGAWERFHKRPQPDGSVAFESAAFPNVYLRMDGQGVDVFGTAAGAGTVNCQFGVGPWERFIEHDPPFPPIIWPDEDDADDVAESAAKGRRQRHEEMSTEERAEVLEQLARARRKRAEVKRALKTGTTTLREVLRDGQTDPVIGNMKLSALIESLPGVGKVRAKQLMERLAFAESKRVKEIRANLYASLLREFPGTD